MSREPWFSDGERKRAAFAALAVSLARGHERNARSLRKLARDVVNPPEGTRVEIHYSGASVTFVTEVMDAIPQSQGNG